MHIKQILGSGHRAAPIHGATPIPLMLCTIHVRITIWRRIRRRGLVSKPTCAGNTPALVHFGEHDSVVVGPAGQRARVRGAPPVNAGVHKDQEHEDAEGEGCVDEDDGAGLRGEL